MGLNKASGYDAILVELFRTLKDDAIKMLHSIVSANLEDTAVATGLERSILIPIPSRGSTKECLNHCTIALSPHVSKVMFKILHARLQHYANQELPDVQAGFRKGRGSRDQIVNFSGSQRKQENSRKNIYLCFTDYTKSFNSVDHSKL